MNYHKKVIRQFFGGIFFPPFMDLKVVFPSDRISIRKHVITALVTYQFQHGHELVNSLAVYHTLITLLRIKVELPCHGIYNAAGKEIVLHGVRLITCLL
jgi:hypothetical protein